MLIYISGKISGTTDYIDRFNKATKELEHLGYEVINPAIECRKKFNTDIEPYKNLLGYTISLLVNADAIYMLKGWEDSAGANVELKFAMACGYKIIYEEDV